MRALLRLASATVLATAAVFVFTARLGVGSSRAGILRGLLLAVVLCVLVVALILLCLRCHCPSHQAGKACRCNQRFEGGLHVWTPFSHVWKFGLNLKIRRDKESYDS